MNSDRRKSVMEEEFELRFGSRPSLWTRAPGRVDLMGSHTDYNQGFVLTLAIDRDTWIAARPRDDRQVHVQSLNIDSGSIFDLDSISHDREEPWANYVRGVADVLGKEGYALHGFDGLIHSTVPLSSGLSSSAALEVATALVFRALGEWNMGLLQMALLCQRAENEFVGMSCGILDQYSSAMAEEGCAVLLDCRHLTSQPVPVPLDLQIMICDTRAKRELTGSEYPERRAQCEEGARILGEFYPGVTALRDVTLAQFKAHQSDLPAVVGRRCGFIIEENRRVLDLAAVLPQGDRQAIRELCGTSYAGAQDLYEITTPETDAMMQAVLSAPGGIGGRGAGAGFGGCIVALVERSLSDEFARRVQQSYAAATQIQPEIYPVQASAGAGLL